MRTLDRLLIADLRHLWRQAVAICLVLAAGIATFTMSGSTIRSLQTTYDRYYRDYRFADLFVSLKRAPNSLARRLAELPGVDVVDTRVVRDIILNLPDMPEPATCRMISLPPDADASLNAIHLRRGRMPDSLRRGEVLASELFAEAHGLRPGDRVTVIMAGREERLRIVGIAMSPEYIYAVAPGQILPDNRHFGILWMPYRQMAAAFNMEGAFNAASFRLASPPVPIQDVIAQIDELTRRYGGLGAFTRDDQSSHRRVADEVHQLRGMALVSPTIFLSVAVFLFNLVFSQIVHHQQEEIATMRAFGYRPAEIGLHYVKILGLLVAVGTCAGSAAGLYLSRYMVDLYGRFFRFPVLQYVIAWDQLPVAACLSLAVGVLGGGASIARAMRLPPAVAMRPESPPVYRPSLVERLGLGRFLSPAAALLFRRLERNPRSTALSILGLGLGVAVLVLGSFMEDTIQYVMDVQFQRAQRQDVTVTFYEAVSAGVVHDAAHLPGVWAVEPFRAVPVRLAHGNISRRTSLMGLERDPRLFRILNANEREVTLPPGGLTVSEKLAEVLDARPGDLLEVELLEGRRFKRSIPIVAVFPDYSDPCAYMNRFDLHRLLQEGECCSGVFLAADQRRLDELHEELKLTPTTAGVSLKRAALESFERTIADNLLPMRIMNATFAMIIAFGVIYNCALMTMAEQGRDLATLRVLGFTRREASLVLLGELAVITLAALPVGLPLGFLLSYLATLALDTESHRFPLVISRATFASATVVILLASAVSGLIVRRMVDKLDLLAVLKVKE